MPWVDPEKLGPFVAWHYVYALLVFGLPTLLLIFVLFFSLATLTRSLMWTYVGAVLTLVHAVPFHAVVGHLLGLGIQILNLHGNIRTGRDMLHHEPYKSAIDRVDTLGCQRG